MAASDIDLTTIAAVAAYIGGIDGTNTEVNSLLQTLITSASAYAENFCGRDFRKLTYTEAYNGTGFQSIILRQAPVVSITSVVADGITIPARVGTTPGFVNDASGTLYATGNYRFPPGFQNIAVTYVAGWVTPGQGQMTSPPTGVTLPMDLQQAVIETVALKYKSQRNNIGIAARQIAGETISYSQVDVPKSAAPVFGFYQRVGIWA